MASIFSYLVMVLFCVSSHSCKCNARSFGVLHKDVAKKNQPLTAKENDEKLNLSRVTKQPINYAIEDAKEKMIINSDQSILDEAARKYIEATTKGESKKVSNTSKGESQSYVSWRVPHKKREEQEPGFNLDYLPPKTHPPEHN